jgi:hypothetical protein
VRLEFVNSAVGHDRLGPRLQDGILALSDAAADPHALVRGCRAREQDAARRVPRRRRCRSGGAAASTLPSLLAADAFAPGGDTNLHATASATAALPALRRAPLRGRRRCRRRLLGLALGDEEVSEKRSDERGDGEGKGGSIAHGERIRDLRE